MLLWLDDLRPAPEGWVWAKTVAHAKVVLRSVVVDEASLDHDLGQLLHPEDDDMRVYPSQGLEPVGYELVMWMAEEAVWPRKSLSVHTANIVGQQRMTRVIERYGPYNHKEHIVYHHGESEYPAIRYS